MMDSEVQKIQDEVVISKLAGDIRVAWHTRDTQRHPVIMVSGCPVPFHVFNMLLVYVAAGYVTGGIDEMDEELREWWAHLGYNQPTEVDSTLVTYYVPERTPHQTIRPWGHAQRSLYRALGSDTETVAVGEDILPQLKELVAELKAGYSEP